MKVRTLYAKKGWSPLGFTKAVNHSPIISTFLYPEDFDGFF
jgi:hypothetical protein